jgi:nicotinamide-nucleotide amidase
MKAEHPLRTLLLAKPKLTLAVAESVTCGNVQAKIGAVPGASDYFLGGLTAYSVEQKICLLGVDRRHARKVNGVSQQVAVEMALGVADRFGADLALATTGFAEKDRAAGVAAPMAWWALCHRQRGGRAIILSEKMVLPLVTGRLAAQEKIAEAVLRELVGYLQGLRR